MKFIWLFLVLVTVNGCACGPGGQRCVTSYTYTQQSPGVWTVTPQYGNY
jgi:hypothetical protein